MLQRNGFINLYNSTVFCLLYLQVRNNQKHVGKMPEIRKKFKSEMMTTWRHFFKKFWQNAQILKSRDSVSNFKSRVSVSEFLMKSRYRLEILTRSRCRRLRSRLHHWCFSNSCANSHPCLGAFKRRVLLTCLVPQCWYPPHRTRHQRRLANCDWRPAPYISGPPS